MITNKRIVCYILGHKLGKVEETIHDLPDGKKLKGIEFGCIRCGKRWENHEPIIVSSDNLIQRFIRQRK